MTANAWPWLQHKQRALDAECFETPLWAAQAILKAETLAGLVVDPCCGSGVLTTVANDAGYRTRAIDLHDWGFPSIRHDYLTLMETPASEFSVFMNPPFSLAIDFISHSLLLGARKIVCFQRFAFWESQKRRQFWQSNPPNRVYICGDRADCWRIDIPPDQRTSSTPTAHAWFVWERGSPAGTLLGHIYR